MTGPALSLEEAPERFRLGETVASLLGLLERDLWILRRGWREFTARAVIQPVMFLFVFTYVFPRIGQNYSGAGTTFATVLTPGLIGYAAFYAGVYSVGMSLSLELSFGQAGLDDRLLSPVYTWLVGLAKAAVGSINAVLAGGLVFVVALLIPAGRVDVGMPSLLTAVGALLVVALLAAGAGMFVGTAVRPEQLPALFTIMLIPIAFLGGIYFSWSTLEPMRWLQVLVLLNPLTYMTEAMRALLTPEAPRMATFGAIGGGAVFGTLLLVVGLRSFTRRVIG